MPPVPPLATPLHWTQLGVNYARASHNNNSLSASTDQCPVLLWINFSGILAANILIAPVARS